MCVCVGVDVQNGASCLLAASQDGHLEVVKYLCERGGERLLMLTNQVSFLRVGIEMQACAAGVVACEACVERVARGQDMMEGCLVF